MNIRSLARTAVAFDLSSSLTEANTERRALLGWYTKTAPLLELAQTALDWGMPKAMVNSWMDQAQESEGVGVTVNQDLSSLRLYTHKRDGLAPEQAGEIVFSGFKCLPNGSVRLDEYQNCGDLSEPSNLAFASANSQHPLWLEQILSLAPDHIPLMFSRITNSGRQSWLATVRHANIDAGLVIGPAYTGRKLLHVAGGIDATKGAFDSFYIASSPSEVVRFIKYNV